MAELRLEELKLACALVDAGLGTIGTGYLAGPDTVATCAHVVAGVQPGGTVTVQFPSGAAEGVLGAVDVHMDCAVIRLVKTVDIQPLRLAGRCSGRGTWDGYGYPRGIPSPLRGEILDPDGADTRNQPALVLSCEMAKGERPHGFSGSPVIVDNAVVGHLKRIFGKEEDPQVAAFGYLYATRSSDVLKLLGRGADQMLVRPADTKSLRVPVIADDEYHAVISYNSGNRAFATKIVREFEAAGMRTLLGTASLAPSTDRQTAARSLAAVVLISRDWLGSEVSQDEGAAILKRKAEKPDFRVIPVWLDDSPVPAEWSELGGVDFRNVSDYGGPTVERLLFAVTGQNPPVRIAAEELAKTAERVDAEGAKPSEKLLKSAEYLIALGKPLAALKLIPEQSADVRARQLRALALAKTGDVKAALKLLNALKREGRFDGETGGLLAGRYRQLWEKTANHEWLIAARKTYVETWEQTGESYPGINAASMLLWAGQAKKSRGIAAKVLKIVTAKPRERMDFWDLATLAEAHLLLEEFDSARDFYEQAIAEAPTNAPWIAAARKSARRDLEAMKKDSALFDDVLCVSTAVAFVGHDVDRPDRATPRFPPSCEPEVRRMIRNALADLQVWFGVSSASAGSDILFLDEMKKREMDVRVVLPCDRGRFVKEFLDGKWVQRFEEVLDRDGVELIQIEDGDPVHVWDNFRPRLRKEAEQLAAQLDQPTALLAVWNGEPGYVADTIEEWKNQLSPYRVLPLAASERGGGG